jgi:O-antigen/teichoic acid export membrane protein
MGIVGLLNSTTGMIAGLTNFGLGTSAVRNVAEAHAQQHKQRISTVVTTLRRLVWITGLLGTFVTLIFAPLLSKITFGNKDYTYPFMLLSITLLFTQLSTGQNVLLQGTRNLKYLAKSSLLGSALGLFITVPLYYFFGINGIVPAIITASAVTLILSWYFSRKIVIAKIQLSFKEIRKEGKDMLIMGFMLSLTGLITLASSYLVRIYIGNKGGVEQVGLYNAGLAIIETYVGLVFTAMGTDYYPRLSSVAHDNQLAKETMNQQAEMAILILAPILMVFFVFIQWAVLLFYSNQFTPINTMIQWAALGMFFRAASWSIAFLYLAKGASKLFFINEFITTICYSLPFKIIGYKYWGLDGLGIAFIATYVIYLLQVFIICNRKYEFNFSKDFIKMFLFLLLCAIACFCAVKFIASPYQYVIGSTLIILSLIYSLKELDKRLDLKNAIMLKLKNKL